MFRMWIKMVKKNHILKDMVFSSDENTNRTRKIFKGLSTACEQWNLSEPIWLDLNKKDFIQFSRTRFTEDSFMEEPDFDYLEICVIEED